MPLKRIFGLYHIRVNSLHKRSPFISGRKSIVFKKKSFAHERERACLRSFLFFIIGRSFLFKLPVSHVHSLLPSERDCSLAPHGEFFLFGRIRKKASLGVRVRMHFFLFTSPSPNSFSVSFFEKPRNVLFGCILHLSPLPGLLVILMENCTMN